MDFIAVRKCTYIDVIDTVADNNAFYIHLLKHLIRLAIIHSRGF